MFEEGRFSGLFSEGVFLYRWPLRTQVGLEGGRRRFRRPFGRKSEKGPNGAAERLMGNECQFGSDATGAAFSSA